MNLKILIIIRVTKCLILEQTKKLKKTQLFCLKITNDQSKLMLYLY